MQRLLNLFLLTVLISPLAHAQLSADDRKAVDQAAFQLTKATVEFVATDTKTYGYHKTTTCPACQDYPSLIQFIGSSKLTKADQLVRDAQKQVDTLMTPSATTGQILNGLSQFLHDRVTKGDKSSRLTLPSYTAYVAQLNQILTQAGVEPATKTAAVNGPDVAVTPNDTASADEPIVPAQSVNKADTGSWTAMIALILSLVNLAGLIYIWFQRQAPTNAAPVARSPLIDELSNRVSMLEKKHRELTNQLNKPAPAATTPAEPRRTDSVAASPNPVVSKQNTVAPSPESTRQEQAVSPISAHPAPAPRPVQPAPTSQPAFQNQGAPSNQPRRREVVLYGRTADLGDGFSVASLLEAPDRDTVFQIEVRTDSQAVYRVTEDPGAQQLALSDPYSYLADACEYMAKLMPNARIRTTQPGQLALQGDKWKIVEKAKISFY